MFCRGFGGFGSGYFSGGGMFIMMGFGLLIFLALIFLGLKLMKTHPHSNLSASSDSALNILNERYARGEINDEEYTKKKTILTK
jgi:putative membrane protein